MTYSKINKQLRVVKRQHQNKSKRSSTLASQLNRGVSVSTNVTTSYWDEDDNDDDIGKKCVSVVELRIDDERNDSTEGIDRHSVQNSNSNNTSSNRRSRPYKRRNFKTSNMLLKDVREIFRQHNNYPQQSHDNYPQQSSATNNTNKTGKAKRQLLTKQLATDSLKETMRLVKGLKLVNTK
jgi:hypothetical protein